MLQGAPLLVAFAWSRGSPACSLCRDSTAYLLSESSLFVMDSTCIFKTCGQTQLLRVIPLVMEVLKVRSSNVFQSPETRIAVWIPAIHDKGLFVSREPDLSSQQLGGFGTALCLRLTRRKTSFAQSSLRNGAQFSETRTGTTFLCSPTVGPLPTTLSPWRSLKKSIRRARCRIPTERVLRCSRDSDRSAREARIAAFWTWWCTIWRTRRRSCSTRTEIAPRRMWR